MTPPAKPRAPQGPPTRHEVDAHARSIAMLWKRTRRHGLELAARRWSTVVGVVAAAVAVGAAIAAWAR